MTFNTVATVKSTQSKKESTGQRKFNRVMVIPRMQALAKIDLEVSRKRKWSEASGTSSGSTPSFSESSASGSPSSSGSQRKWIGTTRFSTSSASSSSGSSSPSSSIGSSSPLPPQPKTPTMSLEQCLSSKRTKPVAYCPAPKKPTGSIAPPTTKPSAIKSVQKSLDYIDRKRQEKKSEEKRATYHEEAKKKIEDRIATFGLFADYRKEQRKKAQEAKVTGVFEGEKAPKKRKMRVKKQFWEKDN